MSLDQALRWAENWAYMLELWPDWAPTDAQAGIWRKRLEPLGQGRLREAIENSAASLIGLKPKMTSILKAYKELRGARGGEGRTALPVQDPCVEQDMLDMRRELEEMHPTTLLANLRGAAPLAVVPFCGALGPDSAAMRVGASNKIIDEYKDRPVDEWPRTLVGFVWANSADDIPF